MSDKSPYTEEYYWTYTFNGSTYSQIFDTKNGQTWRKRGSDQHVFNNVSKIEDLGNHQVKITQGVLEEECSSMLSEFFRKLREKKKQEKVALKAAQENPEGEPEQ